MITSFHWGEMSLNWCHSLLHWLFQKLRYFSLTYLKSFHKKAKLLELIFWSLYDIIYFLPTKLMFFSAYYISSANVSWLETKRISTPFPIPVVTCFPPSLIPHLFLDVTSHFQTYIMVNKSSFHSSYCPAMSVF